MVNKTINAVIAALHNTFGDDYSYLKENNEQGLPTPCFLVSLLRPTSRGSLWRTYSRVMPIVINYFPKSDVRPKNECYDIGERATLVGNNTLMYYDYASGESEVIEIEGVKVSGTDLEIQLVDDNVLQIFVTYDFWTQTVREPDEPVEELVSDISLKQ